MRFKVFGMRKIVLRIPKRVMSEYMVMNNIFDYRQAITDFVKRKYKKVMEVKLLSEVDNFFVVEVVRNMKPYIRRG
jgi:nuclear transport factor 2 (NTF2) superfamily protein